MLQEKESPKISIILPVHNGGKYINEAIKSVLCQTLNSWELLIVDDGSVDNTAEIVKNYINKDERIRYLKNEQNLGIQKSLNKGLKESEGEYIARIDDDDRWIDRDKLKKQFEFLNKNRDYILIGTGVIVVDENGKELFRYLLPEKDKDIRKRILSKNCFTHSSVMFRRDIAYNLGGYPESGESKHIEDYYLWLKFGAIGKFYNLPIYAINYTLRDGSICSKNKIEQLRKCIILIKKYKNRYPNYTISIIFARLRLIVYSLIESFPMKKSLNKLIKIYKSI